MFDPPEKDSEDMNTTSETSSGTAETSTTEQVKTVVEKQLLQQVLYGRYPVETRV